MLNKSIVSYVDILGFSHRVLSAKDHSDIDSIKKIIADFISNFSIDESEAEVNIRHFSDSVIRIRTTEPGHMSKSIEEELSRLCDCQQWCIDEGYVIRGGIAIGFSYLEKIEAKGVGSVESLISSALIDAHKIESKAVQYPIIGFSKDTYELCDVNTKNFIKYDKELEIYYLDYLWKRYRDRFEMDDKFFLKHSELIIENLKSTDSKILQKYEWLKCYHNGFLDRMIKETLTFSEFQKIKIFSDQSFPEFINYHKDHLPYI